MNTIIRPINLVRASGGVISGSRSRRCAEPDIQTLQVPAPWKMLYRCLCRSTPALSSQCVTSGKQGINNCFTLYDSLSQTMKALPISLSPSTSPDSSRDTSEKTDVNRARALAWYTCGPTTYAPAHLGHARTYVCIDIMRRVLESQWSATISPNSTTGNDGSLDILPPLFVMNITDVDDKILAAAEAAGTGQEGPDNKNTAALALARRYEAEFWSDFDALNCLRPHVVTRVTEHVESDIVPFIQRLVDKGMAYISDDGVNFDVCAYNEQLKAITKYGKLAPSSASQDVGFETTLPEAGTNANNDIINTISINDIDQSSQQQQFKKDPRDFVLWKHRKPGESLWWPSPWGEGRPGWHIECSAMIEAVQRRFQDTHQFWVHAGGVDLRFPHHTNEIAQSEAYGSTSDWIPHWVHTGHLHIDGLKMSKSLKNFVSIQDFLSDSQHNNKSSRVTDDNPTRDGPYDDSDLLSSSTTTQLDSPADDFRLWCLGLSGSYRGPATFSSERISEARHVRKKVIRFLMDGEDWVNKCNSQSNPTSRKWRKQDHDLYEASYKSRQRAVDALYNDLDGKTVVEELVRISELGSAHLYDNNSTSPSDAPVEPLITVLSMVRSLLSLVGFSDRTTRVGLSNAVDGSDANVANLVVGGEAALANELVRFRSAVRQLALNDIQIGDASDNMKELLSLCDDLRDTTLPQMGVELSDSGVEADTSSKWRFCVPASSQMVASKESDETRCEEPHSTRAVDLTSIPLEEYFQLGAYKGKFSEFTDDGIPIRNADGSEVSNRLLKKLLKKREAHKKRLESCQQ